MKNKIFKMFLGIFVLVFFFQFIGFKELYDLDFEMWSNQAKYVAQGDDRQFEFAWAYAHPGGTLVAGTLFIQKAFNLSYEDALLYFMSISVSFFIALSVVFCYLLYPTSLWYLATISPLALNRIFEISTPPSTLASVVFVFLFLLTFYLFKNKEKLNPRWFLLWMVVFGFLIATRVDIGIISFVFLIYIFKDFLTLKKLLAFIFLIFVFFVFWNPFMWFMPLQHIADLVYKMLYHYADFSETSFSLDRILNVSVGLILCSPFLFLELRDEKKPFLPRKVILPFLFMTLFLYIIFLTSDYKSERYFLPLLLIWEILLPLFVFKSFPNFKESLEKFNIKTTKTKKDYWYLFVFLLFVSYPFLLFIFRLNLPW